MEALAPGHVVDGTYRIEAMLTRGPRAVVFAVTHLRFTDVSLVLKVADLECRADFEADTAALGILTSPSLAHMVDRGTLPDGRPYRVVMRLKGPTVVEALANLTFLDARITDICLSLSALAIEAHRNGIGPLDFTLPNLMFADGPASNLSLIRVLRPNATTPDAARDDAALIELRRAFERGHASVTKAGWKPPSSVAEMRVAAHTPPMSEPGTTIGTWRVAKTVSDGLAATVHDVVDPNGVRAVLKIAGPIADRATFEANGALMKKLVNRRVVRVIDVGTHDGAPFYVMDPIEGQSYAEVLKSNGPLAVKDALWVVIEMLRAAEEVVRVGGGPTDFSLEHCFRPTPESTQALITHVVSTKTAVKRFGFYSRGLPEDASMDSWSAAIAIYELIAGRLPFPISKHSMAKLWMGIPVPLNARRKEVSAELSQLVNELISGAMTISRSALVDSLLRIREKEMAPAAPALPAQAEQVIPTKPSPIEPVPVPPPVPGAPHARWRFDFQVANCPISNSEFADLTAATFSANGDSCIVFGSEKVARFEGRHWKTPYLTPELRPMRGVRQAVPFGVNRYLVLGEDGRVHFLDEQGRLLLWPGQPNNFALHGITPYGEKGDRAYLLGGSTTDHRGMIAKVHGRKLSMVAHDLETSTLHAAALLPDGSIVAAGAGGHITRLRGGVVVEVAKPCPVNLQAVVHAKDEVLVVGYGAYAFRVKTAPLVCTIERVETTANLMVMAVDEEGNAWAGSGRGVLLRREAQHWHRVQTNSKSRVLAIHATRNRVRAVLGDGTLVQVVPNV